MKRKGLIVGLIIVFALAVVLLAVITKNKNECIIIEENCNVFEGVLGDETIRMLICREGENVTAYYVTNQDSKEYVLQGTYSEWTKQIRLTDEEETVFVKGNTYKDTQNNDCIVLKGTIKRQEHGEKSAYLTPVHRLTGNNRNDLYSFLGYDTEKVEMFTDEIMRLISENNSKALAQIVSYPLAIHINDDSLIINDVQQFLFYYDEIFTQEVRESVMQEFSRYLFANYQGVHLGNQNCLWFYPSEDGESFRIFSILVENGEANGESEELDLKTSVMNAFCKVLCNEETFYCTTKLPYDDVAIIQQGDGYLYEMPIGNTMDIEKYAVVNMDGDIIPEIVLELENYLAFMILRYHEGDIYGNIVNYRALGHLNKNGTFSSNSGVDWGAIRKLYYVGDTIVFNEAVQMQGFDTYYRQDLISDRETWDEIYDKFFEIPEVEWYEYDEESIAENIATNPLFEQLLNQLPEKMEERQRYLDSFSYLLDFTYDEQVEDEENSKARAISYYNGCVYEMNKVYELCQENLTKQEWEALQKEHINWQNNFDKRLADELAYLELTSMEDLLDVENGYRYWNYGDIVLRHVLRLLDAYYGCQFYEVFP